MSFHIGTSGWSYDHWINIVYPADIPGTQRLDHYMRRFDTVELNSSFYHWPRDAAFARWKERLPAHFRMTVKAPRALTHYQRLLRPELWLERMQRSLSLLGDRLGVLLVQLPPDLEYDAARLRYFLERLPAGLRTSIEFRHPSWQRPELFAMLRDAGVAYCVMSGARLPCVLEATASFVYVRLHGPDHHHLYGGSYGDADLGWWAERMREWHHAGRDVYAYFNNDGHGHAVFNAETLRRLLGV